MKATQVAWLYYQKHPLKSGQEQDENGSFAETSKPVNVILSNGKRKHCYWWSMSVKGSPMNDGNG
ncbi:hypothetical protein AZ468_24700 (plasmid) [Vibrio europaeus]|uniref:Uncharacterized protein n=1 Tax=Vibrio europaeus TaxID=300876 RepID=A0A178J631_9VIBR|nr:hypothetical protein AZ468_24700 [Vibrio europaeus]